MSNTALLGSYGAQDSSSLMFRNRILNGAMVIDQRNAGTQNNTASTQYHVDRWNYLGTQVSKFSIQKSAVAPSGFTNSLLFTSLAATVPGASDWWAVRQVIEGFNIADLAWGTASAQSVSLSFWVRSSLTGTFGGSLLNDAANRTYAFTYSITAANTWEYKTVVIPGDTSGTWLTDSNAGIRLVFGLGGGASSKTAAGSWTAGAFWGGATGTVDLTGTNGATLYITGVQLEAGPTATPFERRPIGVETALAMRYYEKGETFFNFYSANGGQLTVPFQVQKRTNPSISTTANTTFTGAASGTTAYTTTGNAASPSPYKFILQNATGTAIGATWSADAEL